MSFNKNVQPPKGVKLPEFQPKGCEYAYYLLDKELKKGPDAKILVYFDPDIDGLYAGLIMEQYIEELGAKNSHYLHHLNTNRAHGFKMDDETLKVLKDYLIIAVDFSVEKEDYDRILRAGINLIVIDHHEIRVSDYMKKDVPFVVSSCQAKGTMGVILNNQYESEPEEFRFLSGAGMVYYFLKYIEKIYQRRVFPDIPAMVGITLLSDIRALESPEAHSFLKYTFNLESEYMKYLVWLVSSESKSSQRFSPFGIPCMTRDFIDYTFSPVINSLLRANMGNEAIELLSGNVNKAREMRVDDGLLRIRGAQKSIISEIMKEVEESENQIGSFSRAYSQMRVCCLYDDFVPEVNLKKVPITKEINITNYIGVACSKIKDEDKTGVIFVIDRETYKVVRGSVRGGKDGVDYLSIFNRNGVPAAGHKNAFGILECDIRNIDFEKINEDIEKEENEFLQNNKTTRSVFYVRNLGIFMRSPTSRRIAKYNELSRDNYRIYLKLQDIDFDDENQVKTLVSGEKYKKYSINGVAVNSFDPTLDIKEGVILLGVSNNKYITCTFRDSFEYEKDEQKAYEDTSRKIDTLNEDIKYITI